MIAYLIHEEPHVVEHRRCFFADLESIGGINKIRIRRHERCTKTRRVNMPGVDGVNIERLPTVRQE